LQNSPAVFTHQRQHCIFVGKQSFIHARMRPQKHTECQLHDAILARPRANFSSLPAVARRRQSNVGDTATDNTVGGRNVYPTEIESARSAHPKVLSCLVVGLPHDDLGQVPHAIVQADGLD
jgi:hypothetical protein